MLPRMHRLAVLMADFHRLDRVLPALDGVQEVADVVRVDVFADVLRAGRIAGRQMDFLRSDHRVLEVLREGLQTSAERDLQPSFGAFELGRRAIARLADQLDAVGIAGAKSRFRGRREQAPWGGNSEPLSSNSTGVVLSISKAHWAMSLVWQPKLAVCPLE